MKKITILAKDVRSPRCGAKYKGYKLMRNSGRKSRRMEIRSKRTAVRIKREEGKVRVKEERK